jgi:hypothetical protein
MDLVSGSTLQLTFQKVYLLSFGVVSKNNHNFLLFFNYKSVLGQIFLTYVNQKMSKQMNAENPALLQ